MRWCRRKLCTLIDNGPGATVSTIEHLMAALAGCGISNALIEIDGPEVPILDGSAARFVAGFLKRGLRELQAPVRAIEVLEPVEVVETARRGRGCCRAAGWRSTSPSTSTKRRSAGRPSG